MCFDKDKLKSLVGKIFNLYRCDDFQFSNPVTQIVGLNIDNSWFEISNVQESVDYYGNLDEVALFKFNQVEEQEIRSAIIGGKQIDNPINLRIKKITLVNEYQTLKKDDLEYDVKFTRAIIFDLEDSRQVAFEKDLWPYSEEINIYKGYMQVNQINKYEEFNSIWGENYSSSCDLEYEEIS